ncbi:GNAT family N-acetyltransferase [Segetibacter aerophilus]|uniref:Alanine acetyltransferase n=1 Tax=Segetibacter aerophilus TaxID=670293 RepID=A0A512BGU7_9BACT|nr:GNAT family N-acetyltransferase [Segetibacter aerophilus]GEO11188.1 alanine acetyltransferase [Segetibacter aerophilus]
MTFTPFPVLETERLLLRQLSNEDAEDVFVMRSDPQVMQYIPRPLAITVEDAAAVIQMVNEFIEKGEKINWGITAKSTGKVIGMIGYVNMKPQHFRAEVGYSLSRAWHRQGIMLEALKCVLKYGFDHLNLHSVEAIIDADNVASGNLLVTAGFAQEGFFKEDFYFNGEFRNSVHYGLLCSEARTIGLCNP